MASVAHIPTDLAPGDLASASFNWQDYEIARISSPEAPLFDLAYSKLWKEFGTQGEMEQRNIIHRRLRWDPSQIESGFSLGYEIIAVLKQGEFAAVRDHTAIIRSGRSDRSDQSDQMTPNEDNRSEAVVHLSHVLIEPKYRGSGMVGWLRAWPIQKARASLQAAGLPSDSPITLAAEMEPLDPSSASQVLRLKSYQRAGFQMVDPSVIQYFQPDFRSPEEIDSSGGAKPLPLRLVIRRVGLEKEKEIKSGELKRIVSSLYRMYGSCFRTQDMASLWEQLHSSYPSDNVRIPLVEPLGPLGSSQP